MIKSFVEVFEKKRQRLVTGLDQLSKNNPNRCLLLRLKAEFAVLTSIISALGSLNRKETSKLAKQTVVATTVLAPRQDGLEGSMAQENLASRAITLG